MQLDLAQKEAGFTLIEVLVALVIVSLLLGTVMIGLVEAKARRRSASDKREAVMLAARLVAERAAAPYETAASEGHERGLHWEVYEAPAAVDPQRRFVLARISVEVRTVSGALLFGGETAKIKAVGAGG